MKTELELALEKNDLHAHLTYAIATVETIISNGSLKKQSPNERVYIKEGKYRLDVSYNSHSIFLVLFVEEKLILHYMYNLAADSYSVLSCSVVILEETYDVDIKKTTIHQQFIQKLRELTFQVKDEIEKEASIQNKKEKTTQNASLELIKRSNMGQLFESPAS